jgi:hypothetical protein
MTSLTPSTVQTVKTLLSCLAFMVIAIATTQAQPVSGYQGKRFIFKVEPVPYLVRGCFDSEFEAVVGRSVSLTLQPSLYMGDGFGADTSKCTNFQMFLNFRRYTIGAQVAPVGVYFQMGAGGGFLRNAYQTDSANVPIDRLTYTPCFKGQVQWGFQRILFRRLALDFSVFYSYRVWVGYRPFIGPRQYSLIGRLLDYETDFEQPGRAGCSFKLGFLF